MARCPNCHSSFDVPDYLRNDKVLDLSCSSCASALEVRNNEVLQYNEEEKRSIDCYPSSIIFCTIAASSYELTKRIIDKNTLESKVTDTGNRTPLHLAASLDAPRIAKLLIDTGANVNATRRGTQTPLSVAASYGSYETAKVLLENGADPNSTIGEDQVNYKFGTKHHPLVRAAIHDSGRVAELLLQKGSNTNVTGKNFKSLFLIAARAGSCHFLESMEVIDRSIPDDKAKNYISEACTFHSGNKNCKIVKSLIKISENLTILDVIDAKKQVPHKEVVERFLDSEGRNRIDYFFGAVGEEEGVNFENQEPKESIINAIHLEDNIEVEGNGSIIKYCLNKGISGKVLYELVQSGANTEHLCIREKHRLIFWSLGYAGKIVEEITFEESVPEKSDTYALRKGYKLRQIPLSVKKRETLLEMALLSENPQGAKSVLESIETL